ncbi:unnamed protein product [Chrysoparadoxa australica]
MESWNPSPPLPSQAGAVRGEDEESSRRPAGQAKMTDLVDMFAELSIKYGPSWERLQEDTLEDSFSIPRALLQDTEVPEQEEEEGAEDQGLQDSFIASEGSVASEEGYEDSFIASEDSEESEAESVEEPPSPKPKPQQQPAVPEKKAKQQQKSPKSGKTGKGAYGAMFQRQRDDLTARYFRIFNEGAFDGALSSVQVTWSKKLLQTAGITVCTKLRALSGKMTHKAKVELSTKVVDSEDKLRSTLLHELCHAAAWLVDKTAKPPHGKVFWKWAEAASKAFPRIEVTTCHSYEINYKYRWECTGCGGVLGRHSKSIDVTKQVCSKCKGRLKLLGCFDSEGKARSPRGPSPFSLFVKAEFAAAKAALPSGTSQGDIMKELSRKWAAQKKPSAGD